ncbi:hypothetical protein D3C76_872310 [compost metagenome]
MDLHFDDLLVIGQLVALYLADLDLPVVHRAALLQRAQALGTQGQVQPGQAVGERGRLHQRGVFGMQGALHRIDGDIDAGYQGFQARHPGQRDPRLDQPEAGVLAQVGSGFLAHLDGRDHALDVGGDMQVGDLADGNALVDHFGLVDLDAVPRFEMHLDIDAGLVVSPPGQPGADRQGDQRENPDRRPVRGLAGLRGGQLTHWFRPCTCYPRSTGDRRSLRPAW